MFARHAHEFVDAGIPVFPVDKDKRPLVRNPKLFGKAATLKLANGTKFADAGLAIWCGPRSGIAAIDIDAVGTELVDKVMSIVGPSPLVAQTPSGGHHIYYRANGERRHIRPKQGLLADLPVDIMGDGGYIIVPPSLGPNGGAYAFIVGSLSDLPNLPTMCPDILGNRSEKRYKLPATTREPPSIGERNNVLFRICLTAAHTVDSEEDLLDFVQTRNDEWPDPLPFEEVQRLTASAWSYQSEGRNFVGRGPIAYMRGVEANLLNPDSFYLLARLRFAHGSRDKPFALANAFAKALCWSPTRFRNARSKLTNAGFIECLSKGGRGKNDPPIYRIC